MCQLECSFPGREHYGTAGVGYEVHWPVGAGAWLRWVSQVFLAEGLLKNPYFKANII